MSFSVNQVLTSLGKAIWSDRVRGTPSVYLNPPKWNAMGVGAHAASRTAAVTDTALSSEVESRVAGVESLNTTVVTNDTYQNVATITAASARIVDEFALFDASSGGNMAVSATLNVISLNPGDGIQFTTKVQLS